MRDAYSIPKRREAEAKISSESWTSTRRVMSRRTGEVTTEKAGILKKTGNATLKNLTERRRDPKPKKRWLSNRRGGKSQDKQKRGEEGESAPRKLHREKKRSAYKAGRGETGRGMALGINNKGRRRATLLEKRQKSKTTTCPRIKRVDNIT